MATFPVFSPPKESPADRRDSASSTSTVPYKRVAEMTPEERLASLTEWAEEQKYHRPGEGGTFGYGGLAGIKPTVYSGPVRYVEPAYRGYIAPPSYDLARASTEQPGSGSKDGGLKGWWRRRKERRLTRSQSMPDNTQG